MRDVYILQAGRKMTSVVAGAKPGRVWASLRAESAGQAVPRCVASGASLGHAVESKAGLSLAKLCPSHRLLFAFFWALLLVSCALAQEEAPDPIGDLALEMEQVVIDLSGMTTDEPVQGTQKQIVARLDKLIEELEKESEQQRGGGSGSNPSKPMTDSTITGGPGGIGDLHAARKTGKQWAELPPHERDRIVQSMTEGFPAHYQKILERYYKRLAAETPAGAAADSDTEVDSKPKASERKESAPNGGRRTEAVKKDEKPMPAAK